MKTDVAGQTTNSAWLAAAYGVAMLGTVALFFVIRTGADLMNATANTGTVPDLATHVAQQKTVGQVLLALLTIIVSCRIMRAVFRFLHQPPVIGEVVAGIALGPSLLGRVFPEAATYVLPAEVAPFVGLVAQLGVIMYMFMVGLELDTAVLLHHGHRAVVISHASIIVPFLLGAGLALGLFSELATDNVPFTVFALFLGVAMSVTAFPVPARILTDQGMSKSPLGVLALTCAAVDDVTAWCLLALVVGIAQSRMGGAVMVILGTVGYIVLMILVVRPVLIRRLRFDQQEDLSSGTTSLVLAALLLSAWTTERIGIHAVFGAFLLGSVIPPDSVVARQLVRKLQDVVSILLLPAFFAYTGMRTQIGLVSGVEDWLLCGLIIVVATAGKFGGSFVAARLVGSNWRDAAALGILMNTRGLMELIVLNIGLELHVISSKLFAMMVLMALITTIATTPVLHLLLHARSPSFANGHAGRLLNPSLR